jgi:hypothetical protein
MPSFPPNLAAAPLPRRFVRPVVLVCVTTLSMVVGVAGVSADDKTVASPSAAQPTRLWIITIAGLGGDERQSQRFTETISAVRRFGLERLGLPEDHLVHFPALGPENRPTLSASATDVETGLRQVAQRMTIDDVVWLVVLAHGSRDSRGVALHLAGPDPPPQQWARWLNSLPAKHQAVMLAGSGSGWLLKPLARQGRRIVTATDDDDEFNATEFPAALAHVLEQPAAQLDLDLDRRVTFAELFVTIAAEVERRFASNKRIPTEHAQLDGDGDGKSVESEMIRRGLEQRKPRSTQVESPPVAEASQPATPPQTTPPQAKPGATLGDVKPEANESDANESDEGDGDLLAAIQFPLYWPAIPQEDNSPPDKPPVPPVPARDASNSEPPTANEPPQ